MPNTFVTGLKRDYLSFLEVFSQSVANVAPSATPALIVPLVSANAGNGTWLSYVLATVTMLLVTVHVNYFARHSASPGSLYSFISRGLGPAWGVIAGWSLILAYLFTGSAVLAGAANYASVLKQAVNGTPISVPTLVGFMTLTATVAWAIAYKDVKLSTRSMLVVELGSVGLIVFLALAFLLKADSVFDLAQLQLAKVSASGIRQGMVLAIFSYVGFESATALGHEAKNPLQTIPRAMLLSVLVVGAMFIFMSYVLVSAFQGRTSPLSDSNAPLSTLAMLAGVPAFGYAIAVGAVISFFACALASINAAARVMFAMARHGLLHASAAAAHKSHATPHVAVGIASVLSLSPPLLLVAMKHTPSEVFGYLGSLATFGFLLAYALLCLAGPFFLKRRGELTVAKLIISALTLFLLSLPIVGSVYPLPATPGSFLPFIFLFLLALGVAWFGFLRLSRPKLLLGIEQDISN